MAKPGHAKGSLIPGLRAAMGTLRKWGTPTWAGFYIDIAEQLQKERAREAKRKGKR